MHLGTDQITKVLLRALQEVKKVVDSIFAALTARNSTTDTRKP